MPKLVYNSIGELIALDLRVEDKQYCPLCDCYVSHLRQHSKGLRHRNYLKFPKSYKIKQNKEDKSGLTYVCIRKFRNNDFVYLLKSNIKGPCKVTSNLR